MYKILRCGWCGSFCDNEGRLFEPTKQLIKADEIVGFDDALGTCNNCCSSLQDDIDKCDLNEKLSKIRERANRCLSTGQYDEKPCRR